MYHRQYTEFASLEMKYFWLTKFSVGQRFFSITTLRIPAIITAKCSEYRFDRPSYNVSRYDFAKLANFFFTWDNRWTDGSLARSRKRSLCPRNTNTFLSGRWVPSSSSVSIKELFETCPYSSAPNKCATRFNTEALLAWEPYSCYYPTFHSDRCTHCVANKTLCVYGDSHARSIVNALVENCRSEKIYSKTKYGKSYASSKNFIYIEYQLGEGDLSDAHLCSDIIVSFGQWGLSMVFDKPWPVREYIEKVEKTALHMVSLKKKGKNVLWFYQTAYPPRSFWTWKNPDHRYIFRDYRDYLTGSYWKWNSNSPDHRYRDYRTDFTINADNLAAFKVMEKNGLSALDFWSPSVILSDTANDGSHFHEHSTVMRSMLQIILNQVCHGVTGL